VLTVSIIKIIIILMMEAISTSEMSVNFYQSTWCNIPEDNDLHTHCCENLKSHRENLIFRSACHIPLC
jgi:hypothetical protein